MPEILSDRLHRIAYSADASVYRELPMGVAYPQTIADVQALVAEARSRGTHLIPRAGGTSICGQVVGSGIVCDISRHWNKILEINPTQRWARVQPGVVRDELNLALKPYGLFFSPETSTSNRCCIGGMLGNNSCGTHSLVYGSTRHHVLESTGVLSDGTVEVFKDYTVAELEARFGPRFWEKEFKPEDDSRAVAGLGLRSDSSVDDGVVAGASVGVDDDISVGALIERIYAQVIRWGLDEGTVRLLEENYPDKSLRRRSCGYAIDEVVVAFAESGKSVINLCPLLCGSEGTLAFVTEIKVSLDPLPPEERMVVCAHCNSLEDSLYANLAALRHGPVAVELMDGQILDLSARNLEQQRNRFFIEGNPAALIIAEFEGPEMEVKAAAFEAEVHNSLAYCCTRVYGKDISRVWDLRKAGLGVLSGMKGDAKPVGVIEDTAVAPERMPAYIADFKQMLQGLGLSCVYYGHISTGELHLRPILNLKDPSDRKKFRDVARETALLVRKHHGSLSGEHGDGRLRGEFIPLMYGDEVYQMMREVKQTWDPAGVFNTGKIVDTPPMDEYLRYLLNSEGLTSVFSGNSCKVPQKVQGPDRKTREILQGPLENAGPDRKTREILQGPPEKSGTSQSSAGNCGESAYVLPEKTYFKWNGEFTHGESSPYAMLCSIEQCNGAGACRKSNSMGGTMCPAFKVSGDELCVTRARANVIRELLTYGDTGLSSRKDIGVKGLEAKDAKGGKDWKNGTNRKVAVSKRQAFRELVKSPEIEEVLFSCLACKGCRSECPSNVDMTRIRAELLQHKWDAEGTPLGVWMVARMAAVERLGHLVRPLYNFFAGWKVSERLIKRLVHFAAERHIPKLSRASMRTLVNRERKRFLHEASKVKPDTESSRYSDDEKVNGDASKISISEDKGYVAENVGIPRGNALYGCAKGNKGKVYLFADEFTNWQEAELGLAFARLLLRLGYDVEIPRHVESGRAAISKGCLRLAKKFAKKNVELLGDIVSEETPLVGIEPSCILSFRDEYPDLVPDDLREKAKRLSCNALLYDEFIVREMEAGRISADLFPDAACEVYLHGHCHQKALVGIEKTEKMLRGLLKGATVHTIPSGCCGMAGSFGYEKAHYKTSMAIGEMVLFPAVRKATASGNNCSGSMYDGNQSISAVAGKDSCAQGVSEKAESEAVPVLVAAPGTSCRQQILDGTGVKAFHPIEILYKFLYSDVSA
ncbi:MAG: FAD-binding protein [Bacteroidales bacterium]|nr:FAD-binding protein [Bacteroidales bacterium]